MIKAECARNITMATNQFQQQRDQSILALEQQQKELNMAKQQRVMAISQQAASMQAQAQQYKLQMEMQQKMSTLYSGAGAGKTAGTGAGKTTGTGARGGEDERRTPAAQQAHGRGESDVREVGAESSR